MSTRMRITVGGKTYTVEVGDATVSPTTVVVDGVAKTVTWEEAAAAAAAATTAAAAAPAAPAPAAQPTPAPAPQPTPAPEPAPSPAPVSGDGQAVKAPMPGKVLSVRVKVGDTVQEGDVVCTIEAMKMEMPISASASGTVASIVANVGDNVAFDDPLVVIA